MVNELAAIAALMPEELSAKAALKLWFETHHLRHVWVLVRDYVLNYQIWFLGLIPCLILERYLPAVMEDENRRSARWMDVWYPIFGSLLTIPFMGILFVELNAFFRTNFPSLNTGLLDNKPALIQMLGAFLITDFMFYVSHFLRHKIRWFWHFHAIHHSQESLNPMTTHRSHFAEGLINVAVRTLPIAFVGGAPINWVVFTVLNGFWGYFIHANVKTNLGPLRWIIVSPQFHRVHHSVVPEHFDKNYGERLILWDWLFGTMVKDFNAYPPTGVKGIERWAIERGTSPMSMLWSWMRQAAYPFYKIYGSVRDTIRMIGGRSTPPDRTIASGD